MFKRYNKVRKVWVVKNRVRIQDVGPSLNRCRFYQDLFTVNFTKWWDFSVSKWCNSLKVRWEEERGETFPPCFLFHQYSPCVVNEHQHKYTHWGFWNAPCALSPDHLCLCNLLQQHCTYSLTLLKSCLHPLNVLYAYSFFVLPITFLGAVLFTVGLSFSFVVLIRCSSCVKGVEYLFHCVLFQSKKWFQGRQAGWMKN